MNDLLPDLRYTARSLRRAPGFAIVAILTLAIGVGATTALFSAVNATSLRRCRIRIESSSSTSAAD